MIHLVSEVVANNTKMSKHSVVSAPGFGRGEAEIASKEFLYKQKVVYDLLRRVDQPHLAVEHYNLGKDYSIERNAGGYGEQKYVKEFLRFYEKGMLPRGEIFSVFYPAHLDQAIALFKVFYFSNDFETLYKTAAWARIHLNEGMFIYVFSVAVFHHPETKYIRVPAFHEIYPSLYFDDEVIKKAYDAKTSVDPTKTTHHEDIIIPANYSKFYQKYLWGGENMLSHYTEDIDVDEVQYYFHLAHPFWMSAKEFPKAIQSRGDRYFWAYKLQYVRYYLERLSNGLGEVESFDWDYPVPYGYHPHNSYSNGLSFPHREAHVDFPSYNYELIQKLKTWEFAILQAINSGYIINTEGKFESIRSQEGLKILGNIVEGNANSVNPEFYGAYDLVARTVLGFSPKPLNKNKVYPSTMQFYGLDQRDPMFWSMIKKIVGFYETFTSKLPRYTFEELVVPGVHIDSVVVDDIKTFYTPVEYFISNGVKAYGPGDKTAIKVRQYRLDHKPYVYTFTVTSKKEMKADVRLFLGPKYNDKYQEIGLDENWKNFMVLDEWVVDLKVGTQKFERSNFSSLQAVADKESGDVFYKKILNAMEGKGTYEIPKRLEGFPARMFIPRGTKEGMTFQLFAYIMPHNNGKIFRSKSPILGDREFLDFPLGFPLDRPVFSNFADLPNAHFADLVIYHQEEPERKWTV